MAFVKGRYITLQFELPGDVASHKTYYLVLAVQHRVQEFPSMSHVEEVPGLESLRIYTRNEYRGADSTVT